MSCRVHQKGQKEVRLKRICGARVVQAVLRSWDAIGNYTSPTGIFSEPQVILRLPNASSPSYIFLIFGMVIFFGDQEEE
jgi:hypothetical protein